MKLVHKPFARGRRSGSLAGLIFIGIISTGAEAENSACAHDQCVDGRIVNRHTKDATPYAVTEPEPGTYRIELRAGDRWSMDGATPRERAELSFDEEPIRLGAKYRVSYDMLVEGSAPIASDWCVVGQWHATPDPGDAPSSPPLGLSLKGRDLIVYTQATAAPRHAKNPKPVKRARVRNIARNTWIPIRYDMRFDPVAGWLDMHIGGTRVFEGTIPLGYNDALGPYFKFGIYRSPTKQTLVVRYRNLRIRELAY